MSTRINQNTGASNLNASSIVAKKTESSDPQNRKVKEAVKKSVKVQLSDQALGVSTAKQKHSI